MAITALTYSNFRKDPPTPPSHKWVQRQELAGNAVRSYWERIPVNRKIKLDPVKPAHGEFVLVQVTKDGGVLGPPSTWTYIVKSMDGNILGEAVAVRTLRSPTIAYDYAPDGTHALAVVLNGSVYLFLNELATETECPV